VRRACCRASKCHGGCGLSGGQPRRRYSDRTPAHKLPTLHIEARLTDQSIFNVPLNLLCDIANIPYNEVQALNSVAGSLLFGGNWWVPSATNLWGIDPGDSTHVAMVTNLFAPFPELNEGMGGLQYQIAGLLAAELPVSASCDARDVQPRAGAAGFGHRTAGRHQSRAAGAGRQRRDTDRSRQFGVRDRAYNPALILPDILQLFGIEAGQVDLGQLVDPDALTSGFDAAMTADLGGWLTAFDPAARSAEFAALPESFGAALGPDLATSLLDLV
jgi:hypothetical protein